MADQSKARSGARSRPLMLSLRFAPLFWCQFFSAFNDNLLKTSIVFLILFRIHAGASVDGASGDALITLSSPDAASARAASAASAANAKTVASAQNAPSVQNALSALNVKHTGLSREWRT